MTGRFRLARVVLGVGLALSLALRVSVLIRGLDAGADVLNGAWALALFDDSGVGLDNRMVPALWEQWFWLWLAMAISWRVAVGVLVAVLRRADPGIGMSVLGGMLHGLVPGIGTLTLQSVFEEIAGVAARMLPRDDPRGARIARLGHLVPVSVLIAAVASFAVAMSVLA